MKFLSAIILLLVFSTNANALTGNDLYKQLSAKDELSNVVALAYIAGYIDANAMYSYASSKHELPLLFCPPKGATADQAADIVQEYLRTHAQNRHEPALTLLALAFSQAWSCK